MSSTPTLEEAMMSMTRENDSTQSTAYSQIVHGEHNRKDEGSEAASIFKVATTFRRSACCTLFFINLLWLLLTVALGLAGLNPINDDHIGEVGLYIPEDEYQQRQNAYEVAKDEADLSLSAAKCAREDASDPITVMLMKSQFEKEGRGNALSKSGLETLRSRENHIMNEGGWEDRCSLVYLQNYPECAIDYGSQFPALHGNTTYSAADSRGCQKPFSPVFFFEKYGDPNFDDIPGTLDRIQKDTVDWLSFTDLLHKDFTIENQRSKILVSSIYAGTPRHSVEFYVKDETKLARIQAGFSISYYDNKHETQEREHLGNWCEDNLHQWFENKFTKSPFRTLYEYPEWDPVSDAVLEDLSLLIVALVLVILYMWIYTGSLFTTAAGIFQILMSFFGANLLYRYCWPTADGLGYNFFTLFCALSLFIIMGIGADDIFVYWYVLRGHRIMTSLQDQIRLSRRDTWQGSATHAYRTVPERVAHVYSHACVAMAVTSTTTVLAFISNLSSPFIGIRTFGVFSALLVTVNYLAVITFFPCVVLVYDKYFKKQRYWWDPLWQRCKRSIKGCCCHRDAPVVNENETKMSKVENELVGEVTSSIQDTESAADKQDYAEATVIENDSDQPNDYNDPLPIFFRDKFAPFLIRYKYWIISVLSLFWLAFLVLATFLEVTPFKLFELLPSSASFHQYTFITENWRTKSSSPLFVHVLYGLEHRDPLNQHGIKTQNFVAGESGSPNWDTSFDLDPIGAQLQLYKVAEELAFNPRSGLKIDLSSGYGINTQLTGSTTGSLENTPDGGASSSLQNSYGVQSFIHALAQWENVSAVVNESAGSYGVRENTVSSCKPCFQTFDIDPPPNSLNDGFIDPDTNTPVETLILDATSPLTDNCVCYGYFPIPTEVCLYETRDSALGTYFKCSGEDDEVPGQIEQFLRAGNTSNDVDWWADYIFALGDSYGRYDRFAMYDIQVQTTLSSFEGDHILGLRMSKKWDDWMDDQNGSPDLNPLRVMVYVEGSPDWIVSSLLVPSGISNMILSLFLAWLVLVFSTGNLVTSSLATVTIGMICTIVLGAIHVLGWGLGPLESVLIVIVVGFSVDYTVHLADSFMGSKSLTREEKVTDALVHTGSSVLSGAISTLSASIPMFGAQIIFFVKFGAFVFMTIGLSLIFSLGFFCAVLTVAGPLGKFGNLSNFYAGIVEHMHKNLLELEEEQAKINASRRTKKLEGIPEEDKNDEEGNGHEKGIFDANQ